MYVWGVKSVSKPLCSLQISDMNDYFINYYCYKAKLSLGKRKSQESKTGDVQPCVLDFPSQSVLH